MLRKLIICITCLLLFAELSAAANIRKKNTNDGAPFESYDYENQGFQQESSSSVVNENAAGEQTSLGGNDNNSGTKHFKFENDTHFVRRQESSYHNNNTATLRPDSQAVDDLVKKFGLNTSAQNVKRTQSINTKKLIDERSFVENRTPGTSQQFQSLLGGINTDDILKNIGSLRFSKLPAQPAASTSSDSSNSGFIDIDRFIKDNFDNFQFPNLSLSS